MNALYEVVIAILASVVVFTCAAIVLFAISEELHDRRKKQ